MRTFGLLTLLLVGCSESTPISAPAGPITQGTALPATDPTTATWPELIARVPSHVGEVSVDATTRERIPHPVAAEIAARLVRGERPNDAEWAELLVRSGAVRHRGVWPVEEPWVVSMRVPSWLGHAVIELEPRSDDFRSATAGSLEPHFCWTCWMGSASQAAHQELGKVRPGDQAVRFVARIFWGPDPYATAFPNLPDPGTSLLWEGDLTLPVRGVANLSEALPPATGADLDGAMQRAVALAPKDGLLRLDYYPGTEPLLRGLAVALEVELRYDGVVYERLEFALNPRPDFLHGAWVAEDAPRRTNARVSPETVALLRERGTWTIAVRGKQNPSLLTDWGASRHFAGSYEFQAP